MDQLIPSLVEPVAPLRDCVRSEAFQTFQVLLAGWIVCTGPHTISAVWQATGLAAKRHHDTAYAVVHSAAWEWDDLGLVLATVILARSIPGGGVGIVVDDALRHKRGAEVAFGGIFLDPVLSSRRHKTFRFGLDYVVPGIAVPIPMRPDRYFCLSVLWRLCRKEGRVGYQTRPRAAAELARQLAAAAPDRSFWLVGDSAYGDAALLGDRPANLEVIGPLHRKAASFERPGPDAGRGRRPQKGRRSPAPEARIEDEASYPAEVRELTFPKGARKLRVQVIRDVLGYRGCQDRPVMVVLLRDPAGARRDEAVGATDPSAAAPFVIRGHCRRWGVELAFYDGKQFLGLHDPRVRSERGVERAHPMALFVGSLVVLWYRLKGHEGSHVHRERPWYRQKVTPTFTDRLGAPRLQMWEYKLFGESGEEAPSPECIERRLHTLAAVG